MPIQPNDIKVVQTDDFLDAGKDKINDNFELIRSFINLLEGNSSPGGTGASETITQGSHGFSVGNVVRYFGGGYVRANAQTTTNAVIVGIVSDVPDVNTFVLTYAGRVSGLSGLAAGSLYYLQNNGNLGTSPGTVSRIVLAATSATEGIFLNEAQSSALSGLSDVDTAGSTAGSVLRYDGTSWVISNTIRGLANVSSASPSHGQILIYDNGSDRWVPSAPPAGTGDMLRSVYDSVGNGVVNASRTAASVAWNDITGTKSIPWENVSNKPNVATLPIALSNITNIDSKANVAGGNTFTGTQNFSGAINANSGITATTFTITNSSVLNNNVPIYLKETGGTNRTGIYMTTGNVVGVGATENALSLRGSSIILSTAPTADMHAATKKYVDDHVGGGGGGSGTFDIALGTVATGTRTIDLENNKSVSAYGTFSNSAGTTTLAFSNVPSGTVIVTLALKQAGTNVHTLAYPANTTFLNGGDGSIDPGVNRTSIVTLVTTDGGTNWLAAVADIRANVYEPYIWNPLDNTPLYLPFAQTEVLDLVNVIKTGTGTLAFARATTLSGSFTDISSPTTTETFNANNVLRITVTGFSTRLAFRIARVG